jgi:hypothetical protein
LDPNQGISLVSGRVDAWADQSSNGNNATAAAAGQRPTFTASFLDGNAGVYIDANSTDAMFMNGVAAQESGNDKPIQIFAICQLTTVNRTSSLFGFDSGGSGAMFYRISTLTSNVMSVRKVQDAGGGVSVTTTQVATADARLLSWEYTGTAMSIGINGTATSVNGTSLDLGNCTLTGCTLGAANSGFGENPYVTVGDIIICGSTLSAADRTKIFTFLANKWPSIPILIP